jgi:hypothetical protein
MSSRLFARHFTRTSHAQASFVSRSVNRLKARYPHIAPSHLVASFLIFHEVTAVLPVLGFFALFQYTDVALGDRIASYCETTDGTLHSWFAECQHKAARVGRHHGWFGFEKGSQATNDDLGEEAVLKATSTGANVVAAYLLVKLLLPVRLGACFWLAPRMSNSIGRWFRGVGARWQARHS